MITTNQNKGIIAAIVIITLVLLFRFFEGSYVSDRTAINNWVKSENGTTDDLKIRKLGTHDGFKEYVVTVQVPDHVGRMMPCEITVYIEKGIKPVVQPDVTTTTCDGINVMDAVEDYFS